MAFWRYGKDRRVVASDFSHQRGMRRIDVLSALMTGKNISICYLNP
jgi:hypothetical protein